MKIGIIGAGKVGCSIGKYLKKHDFSVAGYCSKSKKSVEEAATFTNTNAGWCVEKCVERTEKRINTK